MGDIDELSMTLGTIQSDVEHIRKNTDAIEKKVDKTHDNLSRLDPQLNQHTNGLMIFILMLKTLKSSNNAALGSRVFWE